MKSAKSVKKVKFLNSKRHTDIASPSTSCAVVELVEKLLGQALSSTLLSIKKSELLIKKNYYYHK